MSDSSTPWTVVCQAPLSMGVSRQEYWNGFSFPTPGNLPESGLKARSPALITNKSGIQMSIFFFQQTLVFNEYSKKSLLKLKSGHWSPESKCTLNKLMFCVDEVLFAQHNIRRIKYIGKVYFLKAIPGSIVLIVKRCWSYICNFLSQESFKRKQSSVSFLLVGGQKE